MREVRWWEGHWAERQRINEAASELTALDTTTELLGSQVQRLFKLDLDQGKEIARLQATVGVLIDLLLEKHVLDEDALYPRLKVAMAALEPRLEPDPNGPLSVMAGESPYRTQPPRPTPSEIPSTTCISCGKRVVRSSTTITTQGEICDACYLKQATR
jgi:hypothetical protein